MRRCEGFANKHRQELHTTVHAHTRKHTVSRQTASAERYHHKRGWHMPAILYPPPQQWAHLGGVFRFILRLLQGNQLRHTSQEAAPHHAPGPAALARPATGAAPLPGCPERPANSTCRWRYRCCHRATCCCCCCWRRSVLLLLLLLPCWCCTGRCHSPDIRVQQCVQRWRHQVQLVQPQHQLQDVGPAAAEAIPISAGHQCNIGSTVT
jgi:hypothetical protein